MKRIILNICQEFSDVEIFVEEFFGSQYKMFFLGLKLACLYHSACWNKKKSLLYKGLFVFNDTCETQIALVSTALRRLGSYKSDYVQYLEYANLPMAAILDITALCRLGSYKSDYVQYLEYANLPMAAILDTQIS